MPQLEFFRNIAVDDPPFFDEGPKLARTSTVTSSSFHNTSSIDTSEIDGYRQGVELTLQKHFDAGTVKIHAGEPGHILKRNRYGMDKNLFDEKAYFNEVDYFSPVAFLRAQDGDSSLAGDVITFPIVVGDNYQLDNFIYNGAIEPLTIRAKASFFSIEVPFESHDVRGALMDGNTDITFASDRIESVYVYDQVQHRPPFSDQFVETILFTDSELGQGHAPTPIGFFYNEKAVEKPFADVRFPRDVRSLAEYDPQMNAALSLMSGSTGNYVDSTINGQRAATAGWTYDRNVNVGTDSLAFGGMVY